MEVENQRNKINAIDEQNDDYLNTPSGQPISLVQDNLGLIHNIANESLIMTRDDRHLDSLGDQNSKEYQESYSNDENIQQAMNESNSTEQRKTPTQRVKNEDSNSDSNSQKDSQDDNSSSEGDDPEQEAQIFIENFYNKNYKNYEISKIDDYFHKKVWRIHFDETYDIIYVFLAKIAISAQTFVPAQIPPQFQVSQPEEHDYNLMHEFEALQPHQGYTDLTLTMQVYEVYDRKIQDETLINKPMIEIQILKVEEFIPTFLSLFQQMKYLKNKYNDFCQIVQIDNMVFFFQNKENLGVFDNENRRILKKQYPICDKFRFTKFRTALHFRDIGKINQIPESLLLFNYVQSKITNDDNRQRELTAGSDLSVSAASTTRPSSTRQVIELRTINYDYINEIDYNSPSLRGGNSKIRKQQIYLKDDNLMMYYDNEQSTQRNVREFFMQRIDDSQTYILLFPTGLLLMCGTNPFTIQAKQQLNLKRDESIIDTSYCVSPDGKYQCIWLLDQKLQVWKCSNERNPNQCNWNLVKITIFTSLKIKKFFYPAMTFEDYHMTSVIDKMHCFKQIGLEKMQYMDYQFAYNGTATKVILVQQPNIKEHYESNINDKKEYKSMTEFVEQKMNMTQEQIKTNCISMFLIAKNQNMIINQIFQDKKESLTKDSALIQKKTMNQKMMREMEEENEILEMCYMGKIKKEIGQERMTKVFKQILIRKRRQLEIMLTNGYDYFTETIEGSEIHKPYIINDIMLSQNNQSLIAYYSIVGNETQMFIRIFKYDQSSKVFIHNQDNDYNSKQNIKNLTLDENGDLYEIKIQLLTAKVKTNFRQHIKSQRIGNDLSIQFPKTLIFKELMDGNNQMERVLLSGDGRILMCGRVMIQLNEDKDKVQEIGSIILEKDHSVHKYKFMSLLNDQDRKTFQLLIKKQMSLNQIVYYDFEHYPVSPMDMTPVVYFTNSVDPENNINVETSIIKLHTETLECAEIYKSKFKVIHLAMKEIQEKRDQVELYDNKSKKENKKRKKTNTDSEGDSDIDFSENKKRGWEKRKSSSIHDFMEQNPDEQSVEKNLINENSKNKKATKQNHNTGDSDNTIYLSLVSQSKNQLNVEIIMDTDIDNFNEMQIYNINNEKKLFGKFKKLIVRNKQDVDEQNKKQRLALKLMKAKLIYIIRIMLKKDLIVTSEAGWLQKDRLILTLNNLYYIINLGHKDLYSCSNGIRYGIQQVNMGLYASIVSSDNKNSNNSQFNVKNQKSKKVDQKLIQVIQLGGSYKTNQQILDMENMMNTNETLIKSQDCIQRMEIASLIRFSFIRKARTQIGKSKVLLFFIPCEELNGGSIFSLLSANYNIINPYIDKIDVQFIDEMNACIKNVFHYISTKSFAVDLHYLQMISKKHMNNQDYDVNQMGKLSDSSVHMYQEDISGKNAIDNAFDQNSIFSIKAFVDSLLQLTDEAQFKNCFDKALLLMVNKGMDVKELVNSNLFYPPVWTKYTLFSEMKEPAIRPYSNELDDLEFEDPFRLFNTNIDKKLFQKFDLNNKSKAQKELMRRRKKMMIKENQSGNNDILEEEEKTDENDLKEQYEMQYNYIYLDKIQGQDKISLTRTLKDSEDLALFEQEAIQIIIDYKWETYARNSFLVKLFIYSFFLITFYIDLETLNSNFNFLIKYENSSCLEDPLGLENLYNSNIASVEDCSLKCYKYTTCQEYSYGGESGKECRLYENQCKRSEEPNVKWNHYRHIRDNIDTDLHIRIKDIPFIVRKVICELIQLYFLMYEFRQFQKEGNEYFKDFWNYFELIGIFLYQWASILDIVNEVTTDVCRILFVFSVMFSLVKVLYLIRVFRQLSFLVMMMIQVVNDVVYFMLLFVIFILTFAECYHIVQVNTEAYGRVHDLFALFLGTLRSAMGDFSIIDPKQGFDIQIVQYIKDSTGMSSNEIDVHKMDEDPMYRHSLLIVYFTFFIYCVSAFMLFMIFMNFIIAVIGESYSKVNQYATAHDYRQRVILIYEKEIHFGQKDFNNEEFFPNILIVRKKKQNNQYVNNWQSYIKVIKNFVKDQATKSRKLISIKAKESSEHLINSIKLLENQISDINKDIGKVFGEITKINQKQQNQTQAINQMSTGINSINKGEQQQLMNLVDCYEKPETQSEQQPQGIKGPAGVTASTKEGGHTHEFYDKTLEDPSSKNQLGDLHDERVNKTINHKKMNEKLSLEKIDRENIRNIKSADISPKDDRRIGENDLKKFGIIIDNDQDSNPHQLDDYINSVISPDSTFNMRTPTLPQNDTQYDGLMDINTQHFEDIKKENREIQRQIQKILEIQSQMQAQQYQNQDQDHSRLPKLPILSSLLQGGGSKNKLSANGSIFGEKSYPQRPQAINAKTYQKLNDSRSKSQVQMNNKM